jgi:hypothetical protein
MALQSVSAFSGVQIEGLPDVHVQNPSSIVGASHVVPAVDGEGAQEGSSSLKSVSQDASNPANAAPAQPKPAEPGAESTEKATSKVALSALEKHVNFFKNEDGLITPHSIYKALKSLHMSPFQAFYRTLSVSGVLSTKMYGCPFLAMKPEDMHNAMHPCDTQVFDAQGKFTLAAFDNLKSYAAPGKNFLSELDIQRMGAASAERDNDKNILGIWSYASASEWSQILDLCTDHYETIDGKAVRCMTFATLESFFTDGDTLWQRVVSKELPVAQPEPVLANLVLASPVVANSTAAAPSSESVASV